MSRHRNIRNLDYSEDYDYDDVYGRSLEDEVAVSPSTQAEFIYHRDTHESPSLKSYFDERSNPTESGVHRSISEPSGTKLRPKLQTSPLASSSTSAVSRSHGLSGVVEPPPGFKPHTHVQPPVMIKTEDCRDKTTNKLSPTISLLSLVSQSSIPPSHGLVATTTSPASVNVKDRSSDEFSVQKETIASRQLKPSLQTLAMWHSTSTNASEPFVTPKPSYTTASQLHTDVFSAARVSENMSEQSLSSTQLDHPNLSQLVSHYIKSSATLGQNRIHATTDHETPFPFSSQPLSNSGKVSLSDLSKQHLSSKSPGKKMDQPSLSKLIQIHQSKGSPLIPSSPLPLVNHSSTLKDFKSADISQSLTSKVEIAQDEKSHVFGIVVSSIRNRDTVPLLDFQCYVLQTLRSQYDRRYSLATFSTPSPDDLVQEKQKKVFQMK